MPETPVQAFGQSATTVDTTYDFRREIPRGADPDRDSITLRRYHQLLWSKWTPSRNDLHLADRQDGPFLYPGYSSPTGTEGVWSSDAIVNSWVHWKRPTMADIIRAVPTELIDEYHACAYTIGAYMMWPCNRVTGRHTINQTRGMNTTKIADRIDLTLECVRLYYADEPSPLNDEADDTLDRYGDFFALFLNIKGFVDFWLLQDLVSHDYSHVNFLLPFQDFSGPAVAADVETWTQFAHASMSFCSARNARIQAWADQNLAPTTTVEQPRGYGGTGA